MRVKTVIFFCFFAFSLKRQLGSLTKCHTEARSGRRILKQSNGSHGGTVSAWSIGGSLPILLETLYPKYLSQNLSGICTLHLCCSLCRRHLRNIAFTSVPSVTPCAYYMDFQFITPYFRRTFSYRTYALNFPYIITAKTRQRIPKNSLFERLCN